MGKSVPLWYNKEVDQLERLVKSNECDERSRKYDLQKNLKKIDGLPQRRKISGWGYETLQIH